MNKELFGVFGDESAFRRFRSTNAFDRIVEGESVTVGIRDRALSVPNRSDVHQDGGGTCVVWGELYPPTDVDESAAEWVAERFRARGRDAFDELNGSYLVTLDVDGQALVATDPVRSWECYYTDSPGVRVFGTDPAAVARTIDRPTVRAEALLELFHLSVVTGTQTTLQQLERVPMDGVLTPGAVEELARFVYRPREFDYVGELAERMERAIKRRATLPGEKGLLLSGGYDSRTIAAALPGLDCCYTIGPPDGEVVRSAKNVASQYGSSHRTLHVDERYLDPEWDTVRYGQGIKESLHVHHAGYTDDIEADTIFHALLFDTLLRGHFLPRDDVEVFGYTVPRTRLDPEPDVVETLLRRLGFMPESEAFFPNCDVVSAETATEFARSVVESRLADSADRYDTLYDAIELLGIQNQPTTPFRAHLADRFVESLIAVDAELIDWHLSTPPEYRNTRTFLRAMRRIDDDIFQYPPHDRPYRSPMANEVERFLRRKLPFVSSFDPAWPDRRAMYERKDLDARLFPEHPAVHDLPPRLKLRINDATSWLTRAVEGVDMSPSDVLCPPRVLRTAEEIDAAIATPVSPKE